MEDYFGSTRDMLAKSEKQIREAREKRENAQRADDKRQREGLEKMSASSGQRLSLADMLNRMSVTRAPMETGIDAITKIREQQDLGRRTPAQHNREHDKFEKAGGVENFNRLHPSPHLSRSSKYDFGVVPEMRGNQGTRFEWSDRADPPQGVGRMESRGRVRGDNEGGRHFADGEPESILADLKWLLESTKRLIEVVNDKRYSRGRV